MTPRVTIRIDFSPQQQLGHGKIKLLEMIDTHGSISSAARAIGMSYRRAWLLMDEVNSMFEMSVLETQLGGKGGGHARVTEFGHKLIGLYREMERDTSRRFADEISGLEAKLRPLPVESE